MIFFIKLILIKFKNQLQSKSKIGKDEHDYVIKNDLNLKASFLFADIVKQIESVFSVLSEEKRFGWKSVMSSVRSRKTVIETMTASPSFRSDQMRF